MWASWLFDVPFNSAVITHDVPTTERPGVSLTSHMTDAQDSQPLSPAPDVCSQSPQLLSESFSESSSSSPAKLFLCLWIMMMKRMKLFHLMK